MRDECLWINTLSSLVYDITYHLWGVNSQEREEKVHSFAPWRDGVRLVTSHPQSCYSRISTDTWFSNLGQRLDLAHPHIWICSVAAWGNLHVSSWVTNWWLPFISLTPSLLQRTITSIWHNLRVQHDFNLSTFRKVKAMYSLWLSQFSLNLWTSFKFSSVCKRLTSSW